MSVEPKDFEGVVIGLVDDPESFDVGVSPSLDNAVVIYFEPNEGAPTGQALAFGGDAREKLLACFKVLLSGDPELEEVLGPPKKKVTLH